MNREAIDPDKLSIELDGVSAIACCLSILFASAEDGAGTPNDHITANAFLGIEKYLERIAHDVDELGPIYHQKREARNEECTA